MVSVFQFFISLKGVLEHSIFLLHSIQTVANRYVEKVESKIYLCIKLML